MFPLSLSTNSRDYKYSRVASLNNIFSYEAKFGVCETFPSFETRISYFVIVVTGMNCTRFSLYVYTLLQGSI